MLTEPDISLSLIQKQTENEYGFTIRSMSFIKGGECSWGYKIVTDDKKSFFLKIHTAIDNINTRFDLTYRLFHECGITNITHPEKTISGSLVFYIDIYPTSLFNFIDGVVSADRKFSDDAKKSLGSLIGKVHEAKKIIGDYEIKEQFTYKHIDRLLNTLRFAETISPNSPIVFEKCAQLLRDHKKHINDRMRELTTRGSILREQNHEFVICHGEPHQWNTMSDDNGQVYLIYWDDSIYAPREKDLRLIKNDPMVMRGYQNIVGETKMNPDILSYYDMEWNLSEIDAWSHDIFFANRNETQNEYYLDQLINELEELTTKQYL